MQNDIQNWSNYAPNASAAEAARLTDIVGDGNYARQLLTFGFRPLSVLDHAPQLQPERNLDKPFEILDSHLSENPILVDVVTGLRYRFLPDRGGLVFDPLASSNCMDAVELLMLAAERGKEFPFERVTRRGCIAGPATYVGPLPHVLPLTLRVSSRAQLQTELARLNELFCERCPRTRKLWLRGQECEYFLPRSEDLCEAIYGVRKQSSLLPSAGRYAIQKPDKMGFGISFAGGDHYWKKPFLIWLMRANPAWFKRDRRALDVLAGVLANDDDEKFTKLLMAIQMGHALPEIAALGGGVEWPDEADDLRQWFFAHMKPHTFGITLQQYGYVTSLLDLTEDLEVALYFTQAAMVDRKIRKREPRAGRLIYVFAERRTGDFFRHREELFWGDSDWVKARPPRLENQRAGFLMGSTSRAQNFYANMIVARIFLDNDSIQSSIRDEELFPNETDDLLYATLLESRPPVEGLY